MADHIDEAHNMVNESAGAGQAEKPQSGESSLVEKITGEAALQSPGADSGEGTQAAVDTLSIEQSFAELEKILTEM